MIRAEKMQHITEKNTYKLGFFLIVIVVSMGVNFAFFNNSGQHLLIKYGAQYPIAAHYMVMIKGVASKPFVYRMLHPTLINFVSSFYPANWNSYLKHIVEQYPAILNYCYKHLVLVDYLSEFITYVIFNNILLIAYFFTFRYLMTQLFSKPKITIDLFSLANLLCIALFFNYDRYIYDFMILFIFCLASTLMLQKKWNAFLFVYALSCLSKETTLFLTGFFFIYHYRDIISHTFYKKLLAYQLIIYAVTKLFLSFIFMKNMGKIVQFTLFEHNLPMLMQFNITWLFIGAMMLFLIFYDWKNKQRFLKFSLIVPGLSILSGIFFGYLDEWRIYYESYPFVFLLMADSVIKLSQLKLMPLKKLYQ